MNHSFVTLRGGSLSSGKVEALLREINTRRFQGVFSVTQGSDVYWDVLLPGQGYSYGFGLTIESARKLEIRPRHGEFNHWVEVVFQDELGVALKARCGNEGVSERWTPDPTRYPTYLAYWEEINEWALGERKETRDFVISIRDRTAKKFPKELKPLLGF